MLGRLNEMGESKDDSDREHALAQLRRVSDIIIDNLAEGSRNKLLDPKEVRLMTGAATRTIRLYLRAMDGSASKKTGSISRKSAEKWIIRKKDQENPGSK